MAVLLFILVGLLATGHIRPTLQEGGDAADSGGPIVPAPTGCAAPKRPTVTEALNELLTCLVETHIDKPAAARQTVSRLNFGRIAGSGVTQGPLLTGLYSTGALISGYRSHRLFYDIMPVFPPELGRNKSRGSGDLAKIDAYLTYLEGSPYIVDTFRTLLANDALPDTVLSARDFVRVVIFDHWFKPYGRQAKMHRRGLRDSSGFGHVFVGEYSSRGVSGFHNWLSLLAAEVKGEFAYKGYFKIVPEPLMIASIQFSWLGQQKPQSSFAFGVETEFQMALFSACFVTKPGRKTRLLIKGQPVPVQTYIVSHQPESIASAYFAI